MHHALPEAVPDSSGERRTRAQRRAAACSHARKALPLTMAGGLSDALRNRLSATGRSLTQKSILDSGDSRVDGAGSQPGANAMRGFHVDGPAAYNPGTAPADAEPKNQ